MSKTNWKHLCFSICMLLVFMSSNAMAAEGGLDINPMEVLLFLVSIAGFALGLQALVTLRAHLLRPPELATEIHNLLREGNLEGAFDAAQGDNSFLGSVATATLSNAQYGKEAMESSLADAGEVEANKLLNKIGMLNLIAAIAPMLGLTGTTLGMIGTFKVMAQGGAEITPDKMAKGISLALMCTFLGLMIAIPLLIMAFFLKARVTQVISEVSNDCNECIRIVAYGEQAAEE